MYRETPARNEWQARKGWLLRVVAEVHRRWSKSGCIQRLRFNCHCPECRQQGSGQKTLSPLVWPEDIKLQEAFFENDELKFSIKGEDHQGVIPGQVLRKFVRKSLTFNHTNFDDIIVKLKKAMSAHDVPQQLKCAICGNQSKAGAQKSTSHKPTTKRDSMTWPRKLRKTDFASQKTAQQREMEFWTCATRCLSRFRFFTASFRIL